MNKLSLLLGILALLIAAGLLYANLTLPPESLMLMVGDKNMPWLGPIIFGVAGVILLAFSFRKSEVVEQPSQPAAVQDPEKAALNKRLESMAWGAFLVMLGGFMFIPDTAISKGFWSIGIGLIFLGLNAARYFKGIRMSGFTTFLGILSVLGGIIQLLGWKSMDFAFILIILGAYLILKPWFEKHRLFGKAEES